MRPRVDRIGPWVSPPLRFFWGLALVTSLLILHTPLEKTALAILGVGLVLLAGKRIKFSYYFFLIITVVFFHLLLPFGKVLFQAGPFLVTDGALKEGYDRAITLCGLVFFSLFSVSRDLRLPGALGRLWAQTFYYYEQLFEARKTIKPRKILLSIDGLLERLYPTKGEERLKLDQPLLKMKTSFKGVCLIFLSFLWGTLAHLFWGNL